MNFGIIILKLSMFFGIYVISLIKCDRRGKDSFMISENVNPQSANFNRLGIYVLYYLLVLPKTSECVPVVSMRSGQWDSRAFCKALKLCQIS